MSGDEFIKKLKGMGVSQVRLAEILGVTKQTINAMRHNASVKVSTLERVAQAIGTTVQELISEEPENQEEMNRLIAENKYLREQLAAEKKTNERLVGIIERMTER